MKTLMKTTNLLTMTALLLLTMAKAEASFFPPPPLVHAHMTVTNHGLNNVMVKANGGCKDLLTSGQSCSATADTGSTSATLTNGTASCSMTYNKYPLQNPPKLTCNNPSVLQATVDNANNVTVTKS